MATQFINNMPYDQISVIDKTKYSYASASTGVESVTPIPTGPILYCPFISSRGYNEDNKPMYMNASILSKFGTPNLDKYGLSLYLANRFIEGGGSVLGMRLVDENATYANSIVYARLTNSTGWFFNEVDTTSESVKYRYLVRRSEVKDSKTFNSKIWNFAISGNTLNENLNEYVSGFDSVRETGVIEDAALLADAFLINTVQVTDPFDTWNITKEEFITKIGLPTNLNLTQIFYGTTTDETESVAANGKMFAISGTKLASAKLPVAIGSKLISSRASTEYDKWDGKKVTYQSAEYTISVRTDNTNVYKLKSADTAMTNDGINFALAYETTIEFASADTTYTYYVYEPFAFTIKKNTLTVSIGDCSAHPIESALVPGLVDDNKFTKANFAAWAGVNVENVVTGEDDDPSLSNILLFNGGLSSGSEYAYTVQGSGSASYSIRADQAFELYYPLFMVRSKTKGEFANAFNYKIAADSTMNNAIFNLGKYNNDAFAYKFTDSENIAPLDAAMSFTFNNYIYQKDSMQVNNVFDQYASYVHFNLYDGYEKFVDTIFAVVMNAIGTYPEEYSSEEAYKNSLDYLFGSNITSIPGLRSAIRYDSRNTLTNNVYLNAGDDNIAPGKYVFSKNDDKFKSLFIDAYSLIKHPELNIRINGFKYVYTHVYAPSCCADVVYAVDNFVRKDFSGEEYDEGTPDNYGIAHARFFSPKCSNYLEIREYFDDLSDKVKDALKDYREILEGEWYLVKDPYTYKYTYFPNVYMHAFFEPIHELNTAAVPYAGRNYMLSGFKIGSVVPSIISKKDYVDNHLSGINTVIEDGNGYALPYEQITAQERNGISSDLSEINNVYTLCGMVKRALQIANDARWSIDFNVADYETKVSSILSSEFSGRFKNLTVTATRESVNGAGRNRIACDIYVSFNSILKGITYTFYVVLNEE